MKEVIEKIVNIDNADLGYEIHTNKQVISVLIGNDGNCCEVWGFLDTQDDIQEFIGAELISINAIDSYYKIHPKYHAFIDDFTPYIEDETSYCFVDVNTSKGKLQFTIYNSH